jgi:lipopolysaccharide/colanic/teichoic acid biosynthesis glycosyltransferase
LRRDEHPGGELRRLVDLVVASIAGLVLSPVIACTGVLIRWRLGSPVLFRQTRAGRDGAPFTIYKFRTMRPESYPGEPDQQRDTALGRRIRAASLDELPQLWNVVRGDMSLIGPRPTLPEQVEHYSERQRGRLTIKPGITGWAQVSGRNSLSWPERIELDLDYIERRTVWFDIRIVARTVAALFQREGIYGEGGVNQGFPLPTPDDSAQRAGD